MSFFQNSNFSSFCFFFLRISRLYYCRFLYLLMLNFSFSQFVFSNSKHLKIISTSVFSPYHPKLKIMKDQKNNLKSLEATSNLCIGSSALLGSEYPVKRHFELKFNPCYPSMDNTMDIEVDKSQVETMKVYKLKEG